MSADVHPSCDQGRPTQDLDGFSPSDQELDLPDGDLGITAPFQRVNVDHIGGFPESASACLFVYDLPDLTETQLRLVFGHHGEIVSAYMKGDRAEVEFSTCQAAFEAQRIVNLAAVRGKTCRCLLSSAVAFIQKTMSGGHRLIVEHLDITVESQGLWDMCGLFGQVLDCKVELDVRQKSCAVGFVHFAHKTEAEKASAFMHNMQIGGFLIELRPFESKDIALFTGCNYSTQPDVHGLEEIDLPTPSSRGSSSESLPPEALIDEL